MLNRYMEIIEEITEKKRIKDRELERKRNRERCGEGEKEWIISKDRQTDKEKQRRIKR